jgi:hypothetical protein
VLLVTWAGYPGVVCVTPLAWLIALRVGLLVAVRSRSSAPGTRLLEAALAGALHGSLQGILFFIIVGRLGEVQPDEEANALTLNIGMTVVGTFAGAGLAAFNACLFEQRRNRQTINVAVGHNG